ncbi:MAG: hypothetical protein ACKOXF_08805 [Chitinophagaceae bacterium]
MKQVIPGFFLLMLWVLLSQSCEPKQTYYTLVHGTWKSSDSLSEEVYTFKNGSYSKHGVYDSVMLNTEGQYFINENKDRHCVTVTLVPDEYIPIEAEYNAMMPCENLDIVSINDEKMVVAQSSFIQGKLRNTYRSFDDTLWRIKD